MELQLIVVSHLKEKEVKSCQKQAVMFLNWTMVDMRIGWILWREEIKFGTVIAWTIASRETLTSGLFNAGQLIVLSVLITFCGAEFLSAALVSKYSSNRQSHFLLG